MHNGVLARWIQDRTENMEEKVSLENKAYGERDLGSTDSEKVPTAWSAAVTYLASENSDVTQESGFAVAASAIP